MRRVLAGLGRDLVEPLFSTSRQEDRVAVGKEPERHGPADTRAGAGYERDP